MESFFCNISRMYILNFTNIKYTVIVNNNSSTSEQLVRMAGLLLINLVTAVNALF